MTEGNSGVGRTPSHQPSPCVLPDPSRPLCPSGLPAREMRLPAPGRAGLRPRRRSASPTAKDGPPAGIFGPRFCILRCTGNCTCTWCLSSLERGPVSPACAGAGTRWGAARVGPGPSETRRGDADARGPQLVRLAGSRPGQCPREAVAERDGVPRASRERREPVRALCWPCALCRAGAAERIVAHDGVQSRLPPERPLGV